MHGLPSHWPGLTVMRSKVIVAISRILAQSKGLIPAISGIRSGTVCCSGVSPSVGSSWEFKVGGPAHGGLKETRPPLQKTKLTQYPGIRLCLMLTLTTVQ